jgi:quercetin dioxygenase-like cupin family protein
MRRLFNIGVSVLALIAPAAAQVEGPPVPVEKAAYHWPVFRNDYLMVLRVNFPPGKGAGYHVHSLDQVGVIVEDTTNAGQLVPGEPDRGMMLRLGDFYWQEPGATRAVRNIGTTRIELVEIELK